VSLKVVGLAGLQERALAIVILMPPHAWSDQTGFGQCRLTSLFKVFLKLFVKMHLVVSFA
jgi:hypothetical protein